MSPTDRYSHGHHESVLRSHRWRTAENSAAFVLGELRDGAQLLDVGCGPGTISADFARRIPHGHVTAIDLAADVVADARSNPDFAELTNLTFGVGDLYDTGFADDSFDIVYAHQVLQHVSDPVRALREMRRVVRPEGVVAVRDTDFGAFAWYPEDEVLDRWLALYHRLTQRNGAQADAGRRLKAWVKEAGFTACEVSSSTWTFESPDQRAWWGGLWADRILDSNFAEQVLEYGLATEEELRELSNGFRRWVNADDGVFLVVHGEVLARK